MRERIVFAVVVTAFVTSGCAHFVVYPDDPGKVKAAKIGTRVVAGICTLGITEAAMGMYHFARAANRQQRANQAYVNGLYTLRAEAEAEMQEAATPLDFEKAKYRLEQIDAEIARMTYVPPVQQTHCTQAPYGDVYCRTR